MSNENKSFDLFFGEILPLLNELEEIRLAGMKPVRRYLEAIQYTSVAFILLLILLPMSCIHGVGIILLLYLINSWNQHSREVMESVRPRYKNEVVWALLDYFYQDVTYVPQQKMSSNLVKKSLLFPKFLGRCRGDDFTECLMGETYITFSEIKLDYGYSENDSFKGIFISVEFNKSFNARTVVVSKTRRVVTKRVLCDLYAELNNPAIINLEDPVFAKEFLVIGEDQIESRYELSTSLMQRLLDFKTKVNQNVSYSFVDSHLYVAIPFKENPFEPDIFEPLNEMYFVKARYDYFQLLTGLVEDLDLNTKIWL